MSGILSIGKSALNAAQVGLSVTGHNIANASTPGYSKQVVVQAAAAAQNFGFGYIGQGTEVANVTRLYNEVLVRQMVSSQSASSETNTYTSELSSINNMLSDASAGVNPALNDFFASVQDLAVNPSDIPTRQSMLSNAQSLVNRLQTTSDRLNEMQSGVNNQLTSSLGLVNIYAQQIASLNDTIEKTVGAGGGKPNDLLDQRDQIISELSKQIKTTVVPQGQGTYNIYIGNGLPLVVGSTTMSVGPAGSPSDPTRIEVAYQSSGKTTILGSNSLPGGVIGGLLQFRSQSLDAVQNRLGQIAVGIASDFNTLQNHGVDSNGDIGSNLFSIPAPTTTANSNNTGDALVTATIIDSRAITASDYKLSFNGADYSIIKLSDGTVTSPVSFPQVIDGIRYDITSGAMNADDNFLIQPTKSAATNLQLSITDVKKLALRAVFDDAGNPLLDSLGNPIVDASGIPIDALGNPILDVNGNTLKYPGDNSNGLRMAALQNQYTLDNDSTSYSSAFSQLVNNVGNKMRELKVTGASEAQVLEQNTAAVQAESGVNLDEEATNLLRYQQAYQAAGKMMQIASLLFDELLKLG